MVYKGFQFRYVIEDLGLGGLGRMSGNGTWDLQEQCKAAVHLWVKSPGAVKSPCCLVMWEVQEEGPNLYSDIIQFFYMDCRRGHLS